MKRLLSRTPYHMKEWFTIIICKIDTQFWCVSILIYANQYIYSQTVQTKTELVVNHLIINVNLCDVDQCYVYT